MSADRRSYPRPLKALVLWQPWASAIAWGLKTFETRSWYPTTRQLAIEEEVAVIAAKKAEWRCFTSEQRRKVDQLFSAAMPGFTGPESLPVGAVVCVATFAGLRATVHTEGVHENDLLLGNWGPDRWAWRLKNVRRLAEPFPVKGRQGIYSLAPEVAAVVLARVA